VILERQDSHSGIPQENNQEKDNMAKKITESEILNLLLKSEEFLGMPFGIHGRIHANRVFVLANTLSGIIDKKNKLDMKTVIISSLLHDCGRENDGHDPYHGERSAEKALEFIERNNIICDKDLIVECITRHCPPPGYKSIKPSLESKIVGDADKLDRFRFLKQRNPCRKEFLELKESKLLMDMSSRINCHKWRSFKQN
jgi:HD superfamily phosphodiesterase